MASSLAEECTPLKHQYDSCFNAWFEGYIEPVAEGTTPEQRKERSVEKAKEYEERCGKVWESYKVCVQNAVKKKGLTPLLAQAREEDPLHEPPPSPPDISKEK